MHSLKTGPQNTTQKHDLRHNPHFILIGWLPITPFQMLNFYQSLYSKTGLIIIKMPRAPLHPFPKSDVLPISINKLTLNEPAISTTQRYLKPIAQDPQVFLFGYNKIK